MSEIIDENLDECTEIKEGDKKTKQSDMIYFLSDKNKHKRQKRIVKFFLQHRPKIMLLYGSVRSGKTFCLTILFILLVFWNKNKGKTYLITGNTQGSIFRNVLGDIKKVFGLPEIKLNREGCFKLFGNDILVAEGGNKGNNEKIRGFTLSGCLANEATTLTEEFIQEIQNRLSDDSKNNGWFLLDTNPDNISHYVYQNFVLKDETTLSTGRLNIKCWLCNFTHNPYVSNEYKEGLKASTPSGHMYRRMINGEWCNSSGLIYQDYSNEHLVDKITLMPGEVISYYVGGMDFGWEHYGAFTVFAHTNLGRYILVREIAEKNKDIYWWAARVHDAYNTFGNFIVWCDYARMEYIHTLNQSNIMAYNANKSVLEGISTVASMLKTKKLTFLKSEFLQGNIEMGKYCWSEKKDGQVKDEPVKENDDVLDSVRYAIFSNETYKQYGIKALDSMTI